ncbi:MAG: phosphoenolpyruvate kinase [Phycisphaerales bacterium]|nr:MAG: phosphoenolpyruvate kinase [Phycisphaerales bacterium]
MPDDDHHPPGLTPKPVHVFYGGAHLYTPETPRKLARLARQALDTHAPDPAAFAEAFALGPDALERASRARDAVRRKLDASPIEDHRIDFEDGFGVRTDAEEDEAAEHAGRAIAETRRAAPADADAPRLGIRIRACHARTRARALRTLERCITALVRAADAPPPPGFVVTLPKVRTPSEVATLADELDRLDRDLAIPAPPGGDAPAIAIELLIETPPALARPGAIDAWIRAARGRARSLHLGPYDLLAALRVPGDEADLHHPFCDAARLAMLAEAAEHRLDVIDGPTKALPVGPGRPAIHQGWRRHAHDIRRSRSLGLHAGWDLHPNQLVSRHAANWLLADAAFDDAARRLRGFFQQAARASRVGERFDDASSAQTLITTVARALWCGARTEDAIEQAVGLPARTILTQPFEHIARTATPPSDPA